MSNVKVITLENGLTVVMDHLESVESATVGLWSKVGSYIETDKNNGICHFLEHMVFKGTKRRDTFQISEEIEAKGGYLNAWTSKEKTAWYAKVLKNDVALAVDIVFDLIRNSTFPTDELEKEKGVIVEEIKMYLDDPSDLAYNLYDKICYNGSSIAMPIIGNEATVNSFTSQDFFNHLNTYYSPKDMVCVISGNFNEQQFLDSLNLHNSGWVNNIILPKREVPVFKSAKEIIIKKEIEQTTLIYGLEGYGYLDEDYYKASVTNAILGGGMSSRFFVEIREKRGLAYSVNSSLHSYINCGSFAVSVGCNKDKALEVIKLIKEEIAVTRVELQDKEIEKSKNQLKSSVLMSLENTRNRAERFAGNILNLGKIKESQDIINSIDAVSREDILAVLDRFLNSKESIAVVSNANIEI